MSSMARLTVASALSMLMPPTKSAAFSFLAIQRAAALVAPLEFTLPRADYLALGGHEDAIRDLAGMEAEGGEYTTSGRVEPWPRR